jgi:RNA polymerase sigma-70 factor (ECF subfamily)
MTAYADGDIAAFDVLFGRMAPRVFAFFLRGFGERSVANDLLQTTFLKLHRSRASYIRGAAFRPWLFSLAAHVRIDELRRRRRVPQMTSHDELDDGFATAAVFEPGDDEQDRRVREALAKLPHGQRIVIELHRFEGMTFAEIGKVLGVAETAARVRAFRGYETLRKSLRSLWDTVRETAER